MPTLLRFGGFRVVIYPNDHRPAHVHVVGGGGQAVFLLNCPGGPVALRGTTGLSTAALNGIEAALSGAVKLCAGSGSGCMAITDAQRVAAEAAFEAALARHPKAIRGRYNRRLGRVVVSLDSGLELMFSPALAEGLEGASVEDLAVIEVTPAGDGLHWPALDADLWVPGLLAGQFGSKAWMDRLGDGRRNEGSRRAVG